MTPAALTTDDPARPWFAVQVWISREQATAHQLRLRGYDTFLPCYVEERRWTDRVKRLTRALFAGYVFCRLTEEVLGHVVTTPGVIRIVGDGTRPIAVPTAEIERLQQVIAMQASTEPWPYVEVGQRARIDIGPLRGLEGIVLDTRNGKRLVVSVTLLQRSVAVEVNAEWLTSFTAPAHVIAG